VKGSKIINKVLLRSSFVFLAIFTLSIVSFAQIKLRNALDYDGDNKADYGVFRNTEY